MFINHGTHIFDGASGRMSGSAPNASKSVARRSRQGGMRRFFGHAAPGCSDAGWDSDSPRVCRVTPYFMCSSEKIPPEFPRETILKVDYMSVLVVFLTLIRRLEMWARKGLRGKHFRPENSPAIKNP